jgi:hypothetical protein
VGEAMRTQECIDRSCNTESELASAFSVHLPDRIDELRRLLSTREAHAVRTKFLFN